MASKPKLGLVATGPNVGAPPRKLGRHGLDLWQAVNNEYGVQDSGGIEMLLQACEALDRAQELAEHIARDGSVLHSKGGPKEHPALKAELANRAFITRTLARLGLDVEAIKPIGRPPGAF